MVPSWDGASIGELGHLAVPGEQYGLSASGDSPWLLFPDSDVWVKEEG